MEAAPDLPVPRRRPLGQTGLKVGEVAFGAWAIGGGTVINGRPLGFGSVDDEESLAALAQAFALGVNFVDTADAYGAGHSETLVGRALKQSPLRVHVATKVGNVRRDPEPPAKNFDPEYIRRACDRSLHRLGVTCIDLYQLHGPSMEVIENRETWATLRALKDQGKIAHYGISINGVEEGLRAIEVGEVETIQVVYNLLAREPEEKLFEAADRHGVGIIARVPLASGLLTGKYGPGHVFESNDHRRNKYPPDKLAAALQRVARYRFLAEGTGRTLAQAALKFALLPKPVACVIPGGKTAKQVAENVGAAAAPDFTDAEREAIDRARQEELMESAKPE